MKKLFEFSAMVEVGLVIAADSEKAARKEIALYGSDSWLANGDVREETENISLVDIRLPDPKNIDLDEVAHIIV